MDLDYANALGNDGDFASGRCICQVLSPLFSKSECIELSLNLCLMIFLYYMFVRVLSCLSHYLLAEIPEPTSKELMNFVKTVKSIKLGLQLGVADSDLDIVEKDHPNDHDKQLSKVLSLYMKQSLNPSWIEVTTALWNIGEKRIAKTIADEYGMVCSSMHQISYMISACHHATRMCMLLVSPYTACSYTNLNSLGVYLLSPLPLLQGSLYQFNHLFLLLVHPPLSTHLLLVSSLATVTRQLVGKRCNVYFNIWPTALSLFQLWHPTNSQCVYTNT